MFAAPWADTLRHPGMSPSNPAFGWSEGTAYSLVQDFVIGGLMGGAFAFILSAYLHGIKRSLLPTAFGVLSGALLWWLSAEAAFQFSMALGESESALWSLIWCTFVPAGLSAAVVIALGPTRQRWTRAGVATLIAIPVTFMGRQFGTIIGLVLMFSRGQGMQTLMHAAPPTDGGLAQLQASIPAWTITHIFVGLALGLVFAVAEQIFSTGCLFMATGRNEGRVWPLDKPINRIGTQESAEVRLPMSPNISPIHATIIQKSGCLFFQPVGNAPTGLNGYAVDSAWLSDGDVLGIGGIDLVFYGRSRPPADAPAVVRSVTSAAAPMVRKDFRLIDSIGTGHFLGPGPSTIGRDKDNSICLAWDNSVSRMHATIEVQGDVVSVRDMASQSGVRVGPVLVREQVLKPGDVITLGKTTLTFRD